MLCRLTGLEVHAGTRLCRILHVIHLSFRPGSAPTQMQKKLPWKLTCLLVIEIASRRFYDSSYSDYGTVELRTRFLPGRDCQRFVGIIIDFSTFFGMSAVTALTRVNWLHFHQLISSR